MYRFIKISKFKVKGKDGWISYRPKGEGHQIVYIK